MSTKTEFKKIPYGISDFEAIQQENYYYVDKTRYISLIEDAGRYLFLIRPRRFGKSLWLTLLESYYDIALKDKFDIFFAGTHIHENPTEERNAYLILKFNFSLVNPEITMLAESFYTYVDVVFTEFLRKYKTYFDDKIINKIESTREPGDKLNILFAYARGQGVKLYLLIDEYDNFTNTILSTIGQDRYKALTQGEGFFKYFFNVLKGGTTERGASLSRLFITGVSPVTMDDVTSGFNIGMNISLKENMNALLGFTQEDVQEMLRYYKTRGLIKEDIDGHYEIMSQWYNNYRFCEEEKQTLFNTDMVLYYIHHIITGNSPKDMIDHNVKTDYKKLRHLIILDKRINGNFSRLKQIVEECEITSTIVSSFPAEGLLNPANFISLLFYFGLLTIGGYKEGEPLLKIPNVTIRKLFYEYIREGYEDVDVFKVDVWEFSQRMKKMAYRGQWENVFQYLAKQVEEQTSIRDYLAGEKVIQGFLLAYMNITDHFLIRTEYELGKGFADIYCEPFLAKYPDMEYSYLIELKYIKREAYNEKVLEETLIMAKAQLIKYANDGDIKKTTGSTILKKLILVFSGWELKSYVEI